ncbi:MAG: hypothetical protein OEZ34_14940 [Spirochaetia bacterium]|nr:hypothetical protein [Spirochaetia bacterium]
MRRPAANAIERMSASAKEWESVIEKSFLSQERKGAYFNTVTGRLRRFKI